MPDRYWVGGTGTWNTSSTTNWSATSGGASGASAPTSADNVFFDANSDSAGANFTVTCTAAVCANLSVTNTTPVGTYSGSLTVSGSTIAFTACANTTGLTLDWQPTINASLTIGSVATNTIGGTINFNGNVTYTFTFGASATYSTPHYVFNAGTASTAFNAGGQKRLSVIGGAVTSSGTNFTDVSVVSGSLTMNGALTCVNMTVNGGTLSRGAQTLTVTAAFICSGTSARTISGSTSIVLSAQTSNFFCTDATNLTLTGTNVLSLTNATSGATKILSGPTAGDTATNVFSASLASTFAGGLTISGAFLDVSSSSTNAKTLTNSTRKIYGSFNSLGTGTTYTAGTLATTFARTTSAGVAAFPALTNSPNFPIIFDGSGGAWTLTHGVGGTNSDVTVTRGAVTFSGAMTLNSIASNNSNTRSVIFGSSTTYTLLGSTPIDFTTSTGLTLTTTASTVLSSSGTQVDFRGGGLSFSGTVEFTNVSFFQVSIFGANTFSNLNFPLRTSGVGQVLFYANQTITTLRYNHSVVNNTAYARSIFRSDTFLVARSLSVTTHANIIDADFRDITISGTALNVSGTNRGGDLGGNTGITFPAAKTVYFVRAAGTYDWDSLSWATTTGGAVANANYPLAQDAAVFDDTGVPGGATITASAGSNGLIAFSGIFCTNTTLVTFSINNPKFYGDVFLGDFTTANVNSFTGTAQFLSPDITVSLQSGNKTFQSDIEILTRAASLRIEDDLSMLGSTSLRVLLGGLDLTATVSVSCGTIDLQSTLGSRNVALGGSTLYVSVLWQAATPASGLTLSRGTSQILLTGVGATFNGAGLTYYNIQQSTTGTVSINGSNTFNSIVRPSGTSARDYIVFEAGSTQTIGLNFMTGGSTVPSANKLGIKSSVPGTQFNLVRTSGTNNVSNIQIQDCNATGGAVWQSFASQGNVDLGNNSGWIFSSSGGNFLMFLM